MCVVIGELRWCCCCCIATMYYLRINKPLMVFKLIKHGNIISFIIIFQYTGFLRLCFTCINLHNFHLKCRYTIIPPLKGCNIIFLFLQNNNKHSHHYIIHYIIIIFFFFFAAPENQMFSNCSVLSDMFSLGMVICAIFNHGRPLIQANNSASAYLKQLEMVSLICVC